MNGRRCANSPYDRLLTNPVLRADYRTHPAWYERYMYQRDRTHGGVPAAATGWCQRPTILTGECEWVLWSPPQRVALGTAPADTLHAV